MVSDGPIFDTNLALINEMNFFRHKKQGLQNRPKRKFLVGGKVVGNWGSEVRLLLVSFLDNLHFPLPLGL